MCLPWLMPVRREALVLVGAGTVERVSGESRDFHKPVKRPAAARTRASFRTGTSQGRHMARHPVAVRPD